MTVDRFQYLLVLAGCLLITAPLEFLGDGVYRQPMRTIRSIVPVAVVFVVWDLVAVAGHVWSYNPRYVTGLSFGLPIEELLFFIVIPICALLTFEAVRRLRPGWFAGSDVLRTGLFRRPTYWMSMVIVVGFQILVDGWLTKLSAPIVIYDDHHTSGLRFPFDIPVEDFLFGWALVTAVLLLWERQRRVERDES